MQNRTRTTPYKNYENDQTRCKVEDSSIVRATVVHVDADGRYLFAKSSKFTERIYVPLPAPQNVAFYSKGQELEISVTRTPKGLCGKQSPKAAARPASRNALLSAPGTRTQAWLKTIDSTGLFIVCELSSGRNIRLPLWASRSLAATKPVGLGLITLTYRNSDAQTVENADWDRTLSYEEIIRAKLSANTTNSPDDLEKTWWWIIARIAEDKNSIAPISAAVSAWCGEQAWRSMRALPRLLAVLRLENALLSNVISAISVDEWRNLSDDDWEILFKQIPNRISSQALEFLWRGYEAAGCPVGKSFCIAALTAEVISRHNRADIYNHLVSSWFNTEQTVSKSKVAQLTRLALSCGAEAALLTILSKAPHGCFSTNLWIELLIAGVSFKDVEVFKQLLHIGRDIGLSLPDRAWGRLATDLTTMGDVRRFTALAHAFLDSERGARPITWARLTISSANLRQTDITNSLVEACANKGWPLDSSAFGTFAKAAGIISSSRCLALIVKGCEVAGWPIESAAFISFAVAAAKLRATDMFRRIVGAALRDSAKLKPETWSALLSNARSLGEVKSVNRILESCSAAGWPLNSAALPELLSASLLTENAEVLTSWIEVQSGTIERLTADGTRDLLRPFANSLAFSKECSRSFRAALNKLLILLWRSEAFCARPISASAYLSYVKAASRIESKDALNLCLDIWPNISPSHNITLMDVAISLALCCLDLLGDAGPHRGKKVIHACFGDAKHSNARFQLATLLFDAIANDGTTKLPNIFDPREQTPESAPLIKPDDQALVVAALEKVRLHAFLDEFEGNIHENARHVMISKLERLRSYVVISQGCENRFVLAALGKQYRSVHNFTLALRCFKDAAALASDAKNQSVCTYEIGITYLDMGLPKEALDSLRRSISLEPQPRASQITKAATAALLCGEVEEAITLIEMITSNDPYMEDHRAWLQLAKAQLQKSYQIHSADKMFENAVSIACRLLGMNLEDRVRKEAAALAVEAALRSFQEARLDNAHTSARQALAELLLNSPNMDAVAAICEELMERQVWPEELVRTLIMRLAQEWPDRYAAKPVIRCLSAAMASAYHSGRLGNSTYGMGIRSVFTQILAAVRNDANGLIFEIMVANRGYVLRRILSDYAGHAEAVMSRFLLLMSQASAQHVIPELLDQLSKLVRDQMPRQVEPVAYGGTDAVEVGPRLKKH